MCDLSIYIVKPEKILPGVTTVQQNPIIKNYLTRLNAFRTIQFGNLEDIKKKGRKRSYSTPAHAAAVKKPRKLEIVNPFDRSRKSPRGQVKSIQRKVTVFL